MTDIRAQYLSAARTALALLEADAVAKAWGEPSALDKFTVGGLATHFAGQITAVVEALAADHAGKEVIGLFEHFERATWIAADIDNPANLRIRTGSESESAEGHAAVAAAARTALDRLETDLPGADGTAPAGTPRWAYATTLDDYLATRLLELVVHADDLAYSTGAETPVFDQDVFDTAAHMLARLAAKRHGQPALVRALARAERAPAVISGL